jgi:hypothetical protein
MANTELMRGIEVLLDRPGLEPKARKLIELAHVAQECGVMPCLDALSPLTVAAAMRAGAEAEGAGDEAPEDGADDASAEGGDGFPGGGGDHGVVDDASFSGRMRG